MMASRQGERIVPALFLAPVGHLPAQGHEAAQLADRGVAAGNDGVFDGLELGRQPRGPQLAAGPGPQLAHPELLGPAVGDVIVLAAAPAALRKAQQFPALCLVAGAAEQLTVHETLGHQHGMAV